MVVVGDFNVAHRAVDMHNFYSRPGFPEKFPHTSNNHALLNEYIGVSRLKSQAGCTPTERVSFGELLREGRLVDTYRQLHPQALGMFSYWSQRARNRTHNRGLRLDYALVSRLLVCPPRPEALRVTHSFICNDESVFPPFSDHCPVGVRLGEASSDDYEYIICR